MTMTPATGGLPKDLSNRPSSARLTDYFLGGDDHYAVDRALADALTWAAPYWRLSVVINRAHAAVTADMLARAGYHQFLDLGSGYPPPWSPHTEDRTAWPLYQVVRRWHPEAVFVAVDNDPLVGPHARAAHAAAAWTFVAANAAETARLLGSPALDCLNARQPIAVLIHDVLPWIADTCQVAEAMQTLRAVLPPGSVIALTHATADLHPLTVRRVAGVYQEAGFPGCPGPARSSPTWLVTGRCTARVWRLPRTHTAATGCTRRRRGRRPRTRPSLFTLPPLYTEFLMTSDRSLPPRTVR
ncbi:SAM-dependent methyltransferase [Streptomyces sp. CBMA152]|uniref:SAM-dependent methyltransferase n=1 Tax=Streptomyces sp. CBMA152 TaxID=1896312 RepID=UPI001660B083|nr:SAM-dependent methyltransferase [Streptomyces sp. CBMA152]MBD0742970.1 hypothetical protein [Streptomyces sp. CBMA152]